MGTFQQKIDMSFSFAILLAMLGVCHSLTFTGDVERDFVNSTTDFVKLLIDGRISSISGQVLADVGVPPAWPYPTSAAPLSGWDMRDVRLSYDADSDTLYIGINCFVIVIIFFVVLLFVVVLFFVIIFLFVVFFVVKRHCS